MARPKRSTWDGMPANSQGPPSFSSRVIACPASCPAVVGIASAGCLRGSYPILDKKVGGNRRTHRLASSQAAFGFQIHSQLLWRHSRNPPGIDPQHVRPARGSRENIHHDLDSRRLPRAVRSHKRIDCAFRDIEVLRLPRSAPAAGRPFVRGVRWHLQRWRDHWDGHLR